ncbi:MAG TPA: VWA domain-containing protein [Blastocatellia bacterium]|nr:VWA domain-containing protein [Blastocatellia bacterium]
MEQIVSLLFKYRPVIYSRSRFTFAASPPLIIVIALVVAAILLAVYLYSRKTAPVAPGWRVVLVGLRVALVILILFCAMRPTIVVPEVVPQSSFVAVLMDDSASMQIRDESGQTRLDAVKTALSKDGAFSTELTGKFKVRTFKFSAAAQRVQDSSELAGDGQQTNIAGVVEQAVREMSGAPLAAVVLVTDGAQTTDTDISSALINLKARNVPIFTVGVGRPMLTGDVELARATAPRRTLAGSAITVEMLVRANAVSQKSLTIELTEDSHPLKSQTVPIQGGDAAEVARISFTPSSAGLHRYRVTARSVEGEPVVENNSQDLLVEVEDARPKILYIEGEPRWEYGKLRGAVADEKNILLVSVLRSADGKFYRQGIETGDELSTGFPKSEEELFGYNALLLGSLEATFFSFEQLRTVEQFVARRGGTFVAMGGARSFNAGGYGATPLADLLPVFLRGQAEPGGEPQSFKVTPSERGRDHIAVRLNDQREANQTAWDQMPPVTLPEVLSEAKPGATVILEGRSKTDQTRAVPVLVEERYGRGRSLALTTSDTWRWRMLLESNNKSYETFWRNLLRYAVESVRRQVELQTDRTNYATGEAVRLRAEVSDKKFKSIPNAQVTARVTSPTGRVSILKLTPSLDAGFDGYTAAVAPDEDGLYRVELTANQGNDVIGAARSSFLAGPSNREAFGAAQNREFLRRIASETGGGYYTVDNARELIQDLTHSERGDFVRVTYDLWDMPFNFVMIVALASIEWFIRKRKGLA